MVAALSVLRSSTHGGVPVVVAAHDLPAGSRIQIGDARVITFAPGTTPSGGLQSAAGVVGQTLSGALRQGEPITDVRLRSPMLAAAGEQGLVAAPVRIADAGAVALLHSGDVVDVIAANDGGQARVVAEGMQVIAIPPPGRSFDGDGALVVIALPLPTALALAGASSIGPLSVVITG
jgi:Flp pilus assembly protein CpaB